MKNLFILEHPEHLPLLKKEFKQGDLFIGFTSFAAYELERDKLPFKIPENYYEHDHFFSIYQEATANLFEIVITLDNLLWEVDERFKNLCLKPFFLGIYQFKRVIDNIKILTYILHRIIKNELPEQITIVAQNESREVDPEELYFHPDDPLCFLIIEKFSKKNNFNLKHIYPNDTNKDKTKNKQFNKEAVRLLKNKVKQGLNQLKNNFFLMNCLKKGKKLSLDKRILFINCRNMFILKRDLEKINYVIDDFSDINFNHSFKRKEYEFFNEIKDVIRNSQKIKALCDFEMLNFFDLLLEKILRYSSNFEVFLNRYLWLRDYLKKKEYSLVVLDTLSSHGQITNIMISDICRKENIPCICWMHGGFGANKSFEGFDMTDLLFADHYLTYGEAVSRAIDIFHPEFSYGATNQQKASSHYPVQKPKTYIAGAPFIENQFRNYIKPNNSKKVIVYLLGEFWFHNQYYMGGNRPYTYFQKWNVTKTILSTLMSFQTQYKIVIKEYPNNHRAALLKKFLIENEGKDIEVIGNEMFIDTLLKKCDLTISTWVSTTFFQAAFTDGDQFLFDDADLTEEAKRIISNTCFFSDNLYGFCNMLKDYLENGKFYQKSKEEFRLNFLDSANSHCRAEYIDKLFKKIKKF